MAKKLRICETVLRDGHQSILATRNALRTNGTSARPFR